MVRAIGVVLWVLTAMHVQAERVVIAVIGDYGTSNPEAQEVADLVKSWNPDFVMTVGDNNYESDFDSTVGRLYHEFIYPYSGSHGAGATSNRFFPCLGNHDSVPHYTSFFTLPGNERYYNYRQGSVEIFAVNSEDEPDGTSTDSVQGRWLRDHLAASQAVWKLVYFHRPPYSSGATYGSHLYMQWPFESWGASAVFSGHEHLYERLAIDGIPYFVNGLGGNFAYPFADQPLPQSRFRYNAAHGAMRIIATETNLTFEFINRHRALIDTSVVNLVPPGAPYIASHPVSRTSRPYTTVAFGVSANGQPPLSYQWYHSGAALAGETNTILVLSNVVPAHEGTYAAQVTNHVGAVWSDPAMLTLLRDPIITAMQRQPAASTVPVGAQVSLRVLVQGAGPLRAQWRFNGADLPGETNLTLVISNVLLSHTGEYHVFVRDDFGSVLSQGFPLLVLTPPTVLVPPLSQTMVQGGDVTFSVVGAGDLPINYAWRRGGTVLTNMLLNCHTSFFTIRNLQLAHAGNYRVALTNFSSTTPYTTTNPAVLTILADADRDLMADSWETNFNFLTNSPADALDDADADGMSNRQEYLAGTDPRAANSLLKLDPITIPSGTRYQVTFQFTALSSQTYIVERATSLGNWTRIVEVVALATNRVVEVWDTVPGQSGSARFYRVSTPWLPDPR